MNVNDIIRVWDGRHGGYHVWQVTGIYLGSTNQENMIGLKVLDKEQGDAHGKLVPEMLVPEQLLYLPGVLRGGEDK